MKKIILAVLLLICFSTAKAQYTALRVNTLALATGTINAGVDIALSDKWSLDISSVWNPFLDNSYGLTLGARWWRFEPHVGWFVGAHSSYANFHVGDSRGFLVAQGFSWGYSWILSSRWNFTLEAGAGLYYIEDMFLLPDLSPLEDIVIRHRQRIVLAPSKVEISFAYLF